MRRSSGSESTARTSPIRSRRLTTWPLPTPLQSTKQGSEYPVVIVLLFHQHYTMLQRRLLYTAMTRPKQRIIFIATEHAIQQAVQNTETSERNTLLAARIRVLGRRRKAAAQ